MYIKSNDLKIGMMVYLENSCQESEIIEIDILSNRVRLKDFDGYTWISDINDIYKISY